jgi:effector-binding domain-containing protein
MTVPVVVKTVAARTLAAVRRRVAVGEVGRTFGPALDLVWAFLRTQPGLRTDGHTVFLYHHPATRGASMDVDFGVEVTRAFAPAGEVFAAVTPAGEVATAIHVGDYNRMKDTHDAIHAWVAAHGRAIAGQSWEIYGDWSEDPAMLETEICYLLR